MSQEHDKTNTGTQVSDGIDPQAAPFEPGYQPETLPQISVPDLAEDAQGLTAEALAKVPTLTELVESEVLPAEVLEDEDAEVSEPIASVEAPAAIDAVQVEAHEAPTQAHAAQVDTWGEQLQVRMGKLTDDIHTLNARLDRLEERNKTKV